MFACPSAHLNREARISVENFLDELRPLAGLPQFCGVDDAVAKLAAIRTLAPFDGTRNADELSTHFIGREPNGRIAMSADIDEFEMR